MSNSLLKPSSAWFLRPQHFKEVTKKKAYFPPQSAGIPVLLPPEEEYSVRKYCPITLNHLLPDLRHSKREFVLDGLEEFDANLLARFEKHLEDSHWKLSGSSSAESEEESDTDNNIEERIENDLNSNHRKKRNTLSRMKVLLPNKVNYPQENMKLLLPDVKLNNRRSLSPVLTKSFCTGCINRNISLTNECNKNAFQNHQRKRLHCKDNGTLLFTSINNGIKVNDNNCDLSKNVLYGTKQNSVDYYEEEMKIKENIEGNNYENESSPFCSQDICHHTNNQRNTFSPSRTSTNNLIPECSETYHVSYRRSRSVSPLKTQNFWSVPQESDIGGPGCIFPSPHMMELVRLRKEKLRMEEKMLLKRRQVLELERLRPPVNKWYELKDPNFHREAHRNNIYVKNQKILPLIEDRRRMICETIRA